MRVVLHHVHCQDGFFSAYLAWKKFGYKDTVYIPVNHRPVLDMEPLDSMQYLLKDQDIKTNQYKDIELYVFDFCFPANFLEVYKDLFKSILILDHHETIFYDLSSHYNHEINNKGWYEFQIAQNTQVNFTSDECAAKMVYRHFFSALNVPWYLELISDRDLGKDHFENTDMFYHGLTIYKPYRFEDIDYLITTDFEDIIELGKLVQRNRLEVVKDISKNIIDIILKHDSKEYKGAFINTDLSNSSDVGNYVLLCLELYDFCVMYCVVDNETAHCSIRSTHNFNAMIISEKFKGGGHRTSGGFALKLTKLCDILNNNMFSI